MLTALFVVSILVFAVLFSHPRFLIKHRRGFMSLSLFLLIGVVSMLLAGCGIPTWLTDAGSIIGMVGTSVTSIGAFIAGLTGNVALAAALATVSAWITKVETGLNDLEELVTQYNKAQDPTILSDIEVGLADVSQNLATDFSNLGLPTGVLSVIAGIAALALSQLQAWGSLIPAIKAAPMSKFTVLTPYDKKTFKALVNKILETPTGEPETDAALAKVKHL